MAEKKKKQQPVTPRDLDKSRWIKTPVVYAQQVATLNRMQQDVMFMVSQRMQNYIEGFFNEGRDELDLTPNPAIPDDVIRSGIPPVRLMLSDLVDKYHYGRLVEALKDIRDLSIRTKSVEQMTDADGQPLLDKKGQPVRKQVLKLTPVFSQIVIPELDTSFSFVDKQTGNWVESVNYKAGYVDFKINPYVAGVIFDMNHGFVEHLARIAKYSKTDAASKIYIFIKTKIFIFHSNKFRVSVLDIKRATGHYIVSYDDVTDQEMVTEKYPRWNDYCNYVLNSAQRDLDRLALINDTEFTFRYRPIYKGTKRRGTPDEVEFTIYPSELGKERTKSKGKTPQAVEQDLFAADPKSRQEMGRQDWQHLVDAYKGPLKEALSRCRFLNVGSDEAGTCFNVLFATEDDYMTVKKNQRAFLEFMRLCYKSFGQTYQNVYGQYRKA